jgi:hypothetical protein
MTPKLRLNTNEAAAFLGCSPTTLKISRSTGTLFGVTAPIYRKLGRNVLYDRTCLEDWLKQFPLVANTSQQKNL